MLAGIRELFQPNRASSLSKVIRSQRSAVKGTCNLEGDGPLALTMYEELRKIYTFIGLPNYPSLMACARNLANGKL